MTWFLKKPSTSVREEQSSNVDITLYPNPVDDVISITPKLSGGIVEIFSVYGNKLIVTQIKDRIEVSGLSAGIYFLKYRNQVLKFVKY